jgi:hypothetical protein
MTVHAHSLSLGALAIFTKLSQHAQGEIIGLPGCDVFLI